MVKWMWSGICKSGSWFDAIWSNFAQWRYRSQWSLSEARLLLVENYSQYPALMMWNTVVRCNFSRPFEAALPITKSQQLNTLQSPFTHSSTPSCIYSHINNKPSSTSLYLNAFISSITTRSSTSPRSSRLYLHHQQSISGQQTQNKDQSHHSIHSTFYCSITILLIHWELFKSNPVGIAFHLNQNKYKEKHTLARFVSSSSWRGISVYSEYPLVSGKPI